MLTRTKKSLLKVEGNCVAEQAQKYIKQKNKTSKMTLKSTVCSAKAIFLLTIYLSLRPVSTLPKVLLIGAIFEEEFKDSPAELAFKYV